MTIYDLVTVQKAARLLKISTKTLHERIKAGEYEIQKIGTILVDPITERPLTARQLKAIYIRGKRRRPGKCGKPQNQRKEQLTAVTSWPQPSFKLF